MDAFGAYVMFTAMKNHFQNPKYDYFKYNGSMSLKAETFANRNDKYMFVKLAKKQDLQNFILANIVESRKEKIWVGDVLGQEGDDYYSVWKKRQESLSYSFKNELTALGDNFDEALKTTGEHPVLLKEYLRGSVSIDTIDIIDALTGVFKYWDKKLDDEHVWPSVKMRCVKYKPFMSFDDARYKKLIIEKFTR